MRGIHRSPVNSSHKGQLRGALMFSLICVWINGWVDNCEAGDLRGYRAHYDVSVMTGRNVTRYKTLLLHQCQPVPALRRRSGLSPSDRLSNAKDPSIDWPSVIVAGKILCLSPLNRDLSLDTKTDPAVVSLLFICTVESRIDCIRKVYTSKYADHLLDHTLWL